MNFKANFFTHNNSNEVGLPVPAAPTNPVIDDTANTFAFTAVPGYPTIPDYEYSLDGKYWRDIPNLYAGELKLAVGNIDAPAGTIGIRIKASTLNQAGEILYSTGAFTKTAIPAAVAVTGLVSATTTGSVNVGSNVITLAASLGFAAGDYIILEIGQEPGAGLPGTRGVGGTWPHYSYATIAAMNADTTQAAGFYAWVEETGDVYRWDGTELAWTLYSQWSYYTNKAIPISLRDKIVSVSPDGLTITITKTAHVTVTGANVYFDNHAKILQAAFDNPHISIPAGDYPIGEKLSFSVDYAQGVFDDVVGMQNFRKVSGAGKTLTKIYSPKGCPSACTQFYRDNSEIEDIHIQGNLKDSGFGFDWWGMLETNNYWNPNIPGLIPGGYIGYWNNPYETLPTVQMNRPQSVVNNVKATNAMGYSFHIWGDYTWVTNSDIVLEEGQRNYQGWNLVFVGVIGGGANNITFISPYISNAYEAALSRGVSFTNMDIINGIAASNSSGATTFDTITMTFTENSKVGAHVNSGHPFLDINGYFTIINGHGSNAIHGATINNFHMVHEGFTNTADQSTQKGILTGEKQINIKITNSSYTRPIGGQQHAIMIGEPINLLIDNFDIIGEYGTYAFPGKYWSDISADLDYGPGNGVIKNITGARYIAISAGINLENINPEATIY